MTSSPLRPGASLEEELEYYKKQYEQLETDLAEFQASSKELEEQLERDIDNAEKSERKLKEQLEKLTFEVEEWKTKHKQSKTEANSAQNVLQKEITSMRETNRAMQLKLRDTEVMNDDYERQARNTESSLEDMESKYNIAVERGVLMEEEMKSGEQEREALRIETQRLRDELSELKVENEITLEKLRLADESIERLRSRKPSPMAVESLRARSPGSEVSGVTPSSPTASTPPAKSDTASDALTPPSPPLSDAPTNGKVYPRTPMPTKRRSLIPDAGTTPRPALNGARTQPRHSRGPSAASSVGATSDAKAMKPPAKPRQVSRPSILSSEGLPRSDSLYQIRNLRGRMQKIEARVQSARSKLPAPKNNTPGKESPSGDALPASVTLRRSIRRPSSYVGSQADGTSDNVSDTPSKRESYVKRLSYGIPRPTSVASDRPTPMLERPPSSLGARRPSSRLSMASDSGAMSVNRPSSRAGAQTPVSSYTGTSTPAQERANSRVSNYATIRGTPRGHRPSASVSDWRHTPAESEESGLPPSPSRPSTSDKSTLLSPSGTLKRQSSGLPQFKTFGRRTSVGMGQAKEDAGAMKPPPRRKMSDVGETF